MDWSKLKPLAGKLAESGLPTLGNLVGDILPFPGGAMLGQWAGEWAGKAIAEALGVPATPEAVGNAVEVLPPDVLKARLAAAENEAAAKWEATARIAEAEAKDRTAQSGAINETVRAEAAAGVAWWHWRHLIGYLVLGYGLEQIILIAYVFFGKGYGSDQLTQMFNATTPFTVGLFALLGYVAQDTTNKSIAAMTGKKPDGIIVATAKALGAKK